MLLMSLLALAATPSAPPYSSVQPHRWTVDYSRTACTLARRVGEEGSTIIAFNDSLGYEPGELLIVDTGNGLDRRLTGQIELRLDDNGPDSLRVRQRGTGAQSVIRVSPLPNDYLQRLSTAHRLSISKAGESLMSVDLGNAHAGVEELARCNDDLMQSWGVDVARRRALRRPPQVHSFSWTDDFPEDVSSGLVLVAEVSADGHAIDCRVVASSGNQRLDRSICNRFRSQAHFEPALDATGQSVPAQYVTRVTWSVD